MLSVMLRDPEMKQLTDAERSKEPVLKEEPSVPPCLSPASVT